MAILAKSIGPTFRPMSSKLRLIDTHQLAPLTNYVRGLRAERGPEFVPFFDPAEAGVEARNFLLLQSPGGPG